MFVEKRKAPCKLLAQLTKCYLRILLFILGKNIIALFGEEINGKRKFLTKGILYRFLIIPRKEKY